MVAHKLAKLDEIIGREQNSIDALRLMIVRGFVEKGISNEGIALLRYYENKRRALYDRFVKAVKRYQEERR